MATKKIYDACCRRLRSILVNGIDGRRLLRPEMRKLFGKKLIIDECEMERCSESEQRRHLDEDRVLRLLYLEDQSYAGFIVE